MLLSEVSIQKVRDVSIKDVVAHYVKLNARGQGLCPFHSEKTPSFHVKESKGIYKCFGCGEAGDAIAFVMKNEKINFIPAVEMIAARHNIEVIYEEVPDKEKFEKEKAFKDQLKIALTYTQERYKNNLWKLPADHPVKNYLRGRGFTKDMLIEWQLGWATEEWRHIAPDIIAQDLFNAGERLGIIKRSKQEEKNFDGYRSRITVPLANRHGELIGLSGRWFEIDPADKGKEYGGKYINPPENELYSKSAFLFGLDRASKSIEQKGFAYLVEGYFDVIGMHANGDDNTVGKCGTAFTTQQAALLKKYTTHVVILGDGDEAGRKATVKDLRVLLKAGYQTEVAILPEKEDPDSYVTQIRKGFYPGDVHVDDGVYWYVASLLKDVDGDEYRSGKAKEEAMNLLSLIPNDFYRNNYFDGFIKKYKWKKGDLQKYLTEILVKAAEKQEDEDDGMTNMDKMPKWMDKEEFLRNGYCSVNNKSRIGYYSFGSSGQLEITNFLINPLFHIYAGKDSRHLVQIDNGKKKAVLDIESKALVSKDLLQQYVVSEGPFIIFGNQAQMLRIAAILLANFPRCIEVKFLGWQPSGFFAFVDKVYIPGHGIKDLDEWGIIKNNDNNYLVPAASAAYKELQTTGEDPYEMDRPLTYRENTIPFNEWASMMCRVYKEKGPVAIAYAFITLFRDIVFDIDNNFPHLYGYGERASGKSKWAESINAFFYKKRSAFNLNSGTDFAFFAYMQRFINCPAFLNEFDEKIINPEWFQVIKGIFDGEGRQRGVMGSSTKNRTEIMKVRAGLILVGQYLCTMDDNSIVSRSIIEGFNERDLSDDDKKEFDKLKAQEEKGLSNLLIEIIGHRSFIKENYRDRFNQKLSEWRRSTEGEFNIRIMQNWCHLYTGWQLISEKISLPVTNELFEKYCKQRALHWSGFIRSSDTLSEFWNTFAFLVDQGVIIEGWDYKIKEEIDVKIRKKLDNNQEEEHTIQFNEPTKVIYIRMNNVHKHYQLAYKTRTNKEGMSMDNLKHYFSGRKYFLGNNKQSKFKKFINTTVMVPKVTGFNQTTEVAENRKEPIEQNSSSFVFLYDQLTIDIERVSYENGEHLNGTESNGAKQAGWTPVDEIPFEKQ